MNNQCPCYKNGQHCPKRAIGCHSTCKDYSEWEQRCKDKRDVIRKQKESERMLLEYSYKTSAKLKRKRRSR